MMQKFGECLATHFDTNMFYFERVKGSGEFLTWRHHPLSSPIGWRLNAVRTSVLPQLVANSSREDGEYEMAKWPPFPKFTARFWCSWWFLTLAFDVRRTASCLKDVHSLICRVFFSGEARFRDGSPVTWQLSSLVPKVYCSKVQPLRSPVFSFARRCLSYSYTFLQPLLLFVRLFSRYFLHIMCCSLKELTS